MKNKKHFIKIHKRHAAYMGIIVSLFFIASFLCVGFVITFFESVYPRQFIESIEVTGMTPKQAAEAVRTKYKIPLRLEVAIEGGQADSSFLETQELGANFSVNKAVASAFETGRKKGIAKNLSEIISTLLHPKTHVLELNIDEERLSLFIEGVAEKVSKKPVYPEVYLKGSTVVVEKGKPGFEINTSYAREEILKAISANNSLVSLPLLSRDSSLSDEEAELLKSRAEALRKYKIYLHAPNLTETIPFVALVSFIKPKGGYDTEKIKEFAVDFANKTNHAPENPVFKFEDGKVLEFRPSQDGVEIREDEMAETILQTMAAYEEDNSEKSIELPITYTKSTIETKDVNNLGIKELVGRGTSKFSGSIPSRVHNVSLAASRINGTLIPPGETFSFAKSVGDISKLTGYREAYIIQDGKTILGDGGGVCQVSTTLFRAALNAGLPIVERKAHAYRVGYYEQDSPPGLDATVFTPSVDFKFKNDTENYILVQTKVDTKRLTAEFGLYGTKDGREATLTKPIVSSQVAPPEDQYVDDPSLPLGKITQVEHKAWGAKVFFDYIVKKNGETIFQKSFISNYQPWKAVYLRGTGPIQ